MIAARRGKRQRVRGMTLLEIMISMAIFSVLLAMAFDLTTRSAQFAVIGAHKAHVQTRAQLALTQLSTLVRESTADQVRPFRLAASGQVITFENGEEIDADQDFLCFPVARRPDGVFVFHDGAGSVVQEPRWQGIKVVGVHGTSLREYVQYGTAIPFSSTAPIRITAVSATTITISNGGSYSATFARDGTPGLNQASRLLMHDVAQLLTNFNPTAPPSAIPNPLRLRLTVLDRVRTSSLNRGAGFMAASTFETGVLARNRN